MESFCVASTATVLGTSALEGWSAMISLSLAASAGGLVFEIIWIMLFLLYILNTITGNWSHMDRWWSVAPFVFAWVCYFKVPTSRGLLMAILTTLWGLRLSDNFWRRGGV